VRPWEQRSAFSIEHDDAWARAGTHAWCEGGTRRTAAEAGRPGWFSPITRLQISEIENQQYYCKHMTENSIFPILYLPSRLSVDFGTRDKVVELCEVNNIALINKS
jgi:hypothetical protein